MKKKNYVIDASLFTSKKQAHDVMKEVFSDFEYYGSNLDALHDVLTSITKDVIITVKNLESAKAVIGTYSDTLRRVFTDSAEENEHIALKFEENN